MRAKFLFCLSCLFSIAAAAQNDYLTGTWKGTIAYGLNSPIITIDISMQIKQEGRWVKGIYTIGKKSSVDSCNCGGKLTTKLGKKNNFLINFYQDGIVHYPKGLDYCTFLNYFQSDYSKDKDKEILSGKWFGLNTFVPDGAYDGSGGRFVLKKISNTTDIDIDKYFASKE